jgi:dihydroorotase-like cyclic amidohydrolase
MAYVYEIILKNGIVVDPVNNRFGRYDVGIAEGKIKDIAEDLDPGTSWEIFDLEGLYVIPGIIDLHIHASEWIGGRFAHKMMALAGVTTALDMAGPIDGVLNIARDYGAGLNLASVQYVRPGFTVRDADPSRTELIDLLDISLEVGAIGLKILGGHFPLTQQATALAIELANEKNALLCMPEPLNRVLI